METLKPDETRSPHPASHPPRETRLDFRHPGKPHRETEDEALSVPGRRRLFHLNRGEKTVPQRPPAFPCVIPLRTSPQGQRDRRHHGTFRGHAPLVRSRAKRTSARPCQEYRGWFNPTHEDSGHNRRKTEDYAPQGHRIPPWTGLRPGAYRGVSAPSPPQTRSAHGQALRRRAPPSKGGFLSGPVPFRMWTP